MLPCPCTCAKVNWFVDGAQYHKNSEMLFWLWSCQLASFRNSWSTKFLFAAIPKKWVRTKTLTQLANKAVVDAIAWESTNLLEGVKQMVDQYGCAWKQGGTQIAGDWRAGFNAWCGDWKERVLSHNFQKRNYESTLCCDSCLAVRPFPRTPQSWLPWLYTDFRLDAPWTTTYVTHEASSHLQQPMRNFHDETKS